KLRKVIEIVTYAMFPIVALLIIISGPHGLTLLKSYVSALLWVQLWAPLYAVMNYIINVKAASGMSMGTAGNGLALKYYNYVGSSVASDEAITGVLVIAIPALAWGIVKGTMDAASAIKSAVGGGGGTYASNASQGNITMGNSSLNTSKADMGTHGQYNEAPTLARGSGVATSRGVDGIKTSSFMDGSNAVDGSDIAHKGNLQVVAGSKIGQSAQRQSEVAEQAAGGHQVAAAQKTAAALQRAADFVQGRKASEGTRSSDSISDASGVTEAVATALKAIETFGDKNSLTNKQAAQVLASVSASGGLNLGVANVNAAAQLSGQSGSEAAQLLERARSFAKESGYSKAVDLVRRSTHENAFGTADESSRNASDTIRAGFDQAQEHTDQSNASYQRSVALKDVASKIRENSGSWSASHVRQFVDWMGGQRNDYENTNFTPQSVMHTAEHNPELLNPFVERFMQEQVAPKLGTGVGSVMTSSDVGAFYKEEVGKVPTSASVQEQGKGWLSNVREQASANGVPPSERVESQLPGQVNEALGDGRQSVTDGKAGAEAAGKPVEAKATNQTDPTNTNLLGNAVSNGAAKVLPAGTMYLADKVGAIPDSASVAKPTATEYKGDTTSALIETGAFVAGTAIGGVGGRAVGSVVGEAIGGVAGRAAAQATLPGVVTATEVSYGAIGEKFGTGVGAVAGEMLGAKGAAATNTLRDAEKETVPTERVESQLPGHVNEALGDGRQSVTD
ncbi:MAG: conjugal transfer protein TraG N-terminal domain-containing protein, partial [Deltaproteobacteria bacterium]|nr:conjugal transfer protein TraG N-terminal domain-containing protein [Deltaproteobacteria bacterium]